MGKSEGVIHYQVYRATSEEGKYTKLTTTKETSFTAKSLISGKLISSRFVVTKLTNLEISSNIMYIQHIKILNR